MKLGRERGGVKNGHFENRLNYLCLKKSSRGYLYFIFKSLMPRVHGWICTGFEETSFLLLALQAYTLPSPEPSKTKKVKLAQRVQLMRGAWPH